MTRRDMVQPTEVEIELKKRLDQLTDRLIQKQMQVSSLYVLVLCLISELWLETGYIL